MTAAKASVVVVVVVAVDKRKDEMSECSELAGEQNSVMEKRQKGQNAMGKDHHNKIHRQQNR